MHLVPIASSHGKGTREFILFFVMVPIYFLVTAIFRKRDMEDLREKYDYNWDKVFSGRVWLVIYIIFSFILSVVIAYWSRK